MASRLHGILLTGGTSRRMGRDKALVEVDGEPLARRTARLLIAEAPATIEVGPGRSGMPAVTEDPPGAGPLAAVVAGWRAVVSRSGPAPGALVLACDLPDLVPELLALLAGHPGTASVVPVRDGKAQPLCARWSAADLERAADQLASGERSLRSAFGPDAIRVDEEHWGRAVPAVALDDVDTPADLAARGLAPPPTGHEWIALTRHPLPVQGATEWAALPSCGAVVSFLGTVRDHAEGRVGVKELVYEAYDEPALARMGAVTSSARARWPAVARLAVLHRLGRLEVGDVAVVVVASSPHRLDALGAAGYVIDTVKETVPIWKQERWRDGEAWATGATPVRTL